MRFYVRSDSVVSRMIAGETLIVPVRKGLGDLASIYSLNEVASIIWEALQQRRNQDEIVELVKQEFEGEADEVKRDVETFLTEMHSAGLVLLLSEPEAA
jgi:coenzyme PQQ synthesis protein D (PqqD)